MRASCSSVAEIKINPEAKSKNGVKCWNAMGSPIEGLSFKTKQISMIRDIPAAINV